MTIVPRSACQRERLEQLAAQAWPQERDDIRALLAENTALAAALREAKVALEPLAALSYGKEGDADISPVLIDHRSGDVSLSLGLERDSTATLGDLRRAAAALAAINAALPQTEKE